MKQKIAKLFNQLSKWVTKVTPRADYLAHDFWGNHLWSVLGIIIAIVISLFFSSYWLTLLPLITTAVPAASKEFSDGRGFGNKDPKDFLWTLASVPKAMIIVAMWIKIFA